MWLFLASLTILGEERNFDRRFIACNTEEFSLQVQGGGGRITIPINKPVRHSEDMKFSKKLGIPVQSISHFAVPGEASPFAQTPAAGIPDLTLGHLEFI